MGRGDEGLGQCRIPVEFPNSLIVWWIQSSSVHVGDMTVTRSFAICFLFPASEEELWRSTAHFLMLLLELLTTRGKIRRGLITYFSKNDFSMIKGILTLWYLDAKMWSLRHCLSSILTKAFPIPLKNVVSTSNENLMQT